MMPKSKDEFYRLCVIADLHCGSIVGMTPPEFNSQVGGEKSQSVRKELFESFTGRIKAVQKQHKID
jgi:hypothetical protein